MTIVARTDFPPGSVAELIEYIKTNKDQVTLANAGIGSASHLCGMLLMDALDTPMTTVPYKGTGPAMTDLHGRPGRPDVRPDHQHHEPDQERQDQGLRGHHQDAGAFAARSADAGLPRACRASRSAVWHGLYAPAGTPPEVVEKLAAALQAALQDPKVIERFADLGTEPVAAGPGHAGGAATRISQAEIARWQPIIEAAGVYAD